MTEEKVRSAKQQALSIMVKVISIFIGCFLVMTIITTAACISSVESKLPDDVVSAEDSYETVQQEADQTETESREKSLPPKNYESTMSRMLTGKETAKGDRAVELERITIKKAREKKKREKENRRRLKNINLSSSNLELMAHLIYGEAGDQGDECQQAVGMVVINRVNDKDFKCTTIKEAIFAPSQYACTTDGNFYRTPSKQAYRNAKAVLTGNMILNVPKDIVYQSQFSQGSKIWRKIGTETFCHK